MSLPTNSPVIDLSHELTRGFAARFIRYKVSRLIGMAGTKLDDWDDLEQDIKLHLVQRFSKFDPQVSHWNAFVVTVITRYILTLIMNRRRHKRWPDSGVMSLDALLGEYEDGLDDPESCGVTMQGDVGVACDRTAEHDLSLDVQEVLGRLPRHRQELCQRLMCDSPAEVARQMHMPRTTLLRHISWLRPYFDPSGEESEKNSATL
jgi:DNA-directed RNA polymerase specialized sigma24 family protein